MIKTKQLQFTKNLILGAGLSGLSAAYFLQDDDYLILEKDSTPGGFCRTIPNERYVWDYAGHFYHFRTEKYRQLFLSLVEPEEIVRQKKNTKIFYRNQLIDYPFQTNIHELEKPEFIECLYDLYFRDQMQSYDDFLDMLYAKFGKAITEKFLRPYNEKLYATDLHSLDKDAMGRFFPHADFDVVMRNMKDQVTTSYNDEFMYLKKGTGYFIDKLFAKLKPEKIFFSTPIVAIDTATKIATTSSGQHIAYENLVNTIPFNKFLSFINNDHQYDELVNRLSYNKVVVFNLGFDRPSPKFTSEHWLYFPDKTFNFYRIGFYNNILSQKELSVYVEIGFSKNTGSIDYDSELGKTLDGMKKAGIIDNDMKLVDKSVLIMDPAYVHITSADEKELQEIFKNLEKNHIFTLGRYGRWTYNSMEDCISLADFLAQRLLENGL